MFSKSDQVADLRARIASECMFSKSDQTIGLNEALKDIHSLALRARNNVRDTTLKPDQILELNVCDPAMCSGAFLVGACRQVAETLVTPWRVYECMPMIPPDGDEILHARRIVAERSLRFPEREIHRKDAKSAKKGDELAHNPLTIRLVPSWISRLRTGPSPT